MMKRIVIPLLLTAVSVQAQQVSEQEARQIAGSFFESRCGESKWTRGYELAYQSPDAYYIFNRESGGFVIVAADKRAARQVLAYSDRGSFCYETAAPGAKALLSGYAEEMCSLRTLDPPHPCTPAKRSQGAVEPLLTTTWNQSEPFNNLCPEATGGTMPGYGGHCPTGCEITAVAQIMNYWQWPSRGSRSHYHAKLGTIDFTESAYDWDNMLDSYSGSFTTTQADAVARLMRDLGCALGAGYHWDGTSTSPYEVPMALVRYFGYSAFQESVGCPGDDNHDDLIMAELDARRPVLCSVTVPGSSSHSVVCDGYDAEGYLHMNYGWGGQSDGYYLSTATYNGGNITDIIIGIQPPQHKEKIDGVWYECSSDEVIVTCPEGNDAYQGDIVIADEVSMGDLTLPVNRIFERVFEREEVTNLTIPGTFKTIPVGPTLLAPTLRELTLSAGTEAIGQEAFSGCNQLERIHLSETLIEVGDNAFSGCSNLKELSGGWPSTLQHIGDNAFSGCKLLTTIPAFPPSLRHIGNTAFWYTPLEGIELQGPGCSIGNYAFGPKEGYSLSYARGLEYVAALGDHAIVLSTGGTFTVQPTTSYGYYAVEAPFDNVVLPADLESFDIHSVIGTAAYSVEDGSKHFSSREGLLYDAEGTTLLAVPKDQLFLGQRFTRYDVFIPAGVTTIAPGALMCNPSSLTLPTTLTKADGAFAECTGLWTVTCLSPTPPEATDENTFGRYDKLTLFVPAGSRAAYEHHDIWGRFPINDSSVKVEGRYCYQVYASSGYAELLGRNALAPFDGHADDLPTEVTLGDVSVPLTLVNEYAFRGDRNLLSLTLPEGVSQLKTGAVMNCPELLTLNVPASMYFLGRDDYSYIDPFEGCTSLAAINVEAGCERYYSEDGILYCNDFSKQMWLTYVPPFRLQANGLPVERTDVKIADQAVAIVENNTFHNDLHSVVIPANMDNLGGSTFDHCPNLHTITNLATVPQTAPYFGAIQLPTGMYDATLRVPRGSKPLYEQASIWRFFTSIVEIEDGATDIDPKALNHQETTIGSPVENLYDLQGRRVNTPSSKGVYIVNGRKVVVK